MTSLIQQQPPSCNAETERFAEDLKAYVDQELTPLRRAAVARHLRGCAACREEVRELEKSSDLLRTAAAQEAQTALSPALRARLLDTMRSEAGEQQKTAPAPVPLWRAHPFAVFGTGSAALVAATAAFLMIYTQANPDTSMVAAEKATTSAPAAAPQVAAAAEAEAEETTARPLAETASRAASDTPAMAPMPSAGSAAFRAPAAPAPPGVTSKAKPEAFAARMQDSIPREVQGEVYRYGGEPKSQIANQAPVEVKGRAAARVDAAAPTLGTSVPPVAFSFYSGRQVHREASIGVAVARLEPASEAAERLAVEVGGFVASNNLSTASDGIKSADLTLRVPVKEFDAVMTRLAKLGEVVSKSVSGEDITEQLSNATQAESVLAAEVRENAAKLSRSRMSDRRTTQKEQELRQLKIQHAQTQAQLGLLRKMGTLSTISVNLSEKKQNVAPTAPQSGFLHDLKETNRAASLAFQSAIRVPVVLVIWILAFSPIWAPLLLAYRYASRRAAAASTGR